jgi:hypothetical protein
LIEKKIIKWANGEMPVTTTNQNMKPAYNPTDPPSIKQFIYTYAPPAENDTAGYINMVLNGIKSVAPNATQDTLVIDIIKNTKLNTPQSDTKTFKLSEDNITISPNPVSVSEQVTVTIQSDFLPYNTVRLAVATTAGKISDTHAWNNVTRGILKFDAPEAAGLYFISIIADSDKVATKLQVQ